MIVVEKMSQKPILKVTETDDSESEMDDNMEEESSDGDSEGGKYQSDDESALMTNEGWADSISKILASGKPKSKKTLVLSRAKKYSHTIEKVKDEKPKFEVVGDENKEKTEIKQEQESNEPAAKKKKHEKSTIRVKPNILEKDRERLLNKIATKGVVQLFNAVRNQQKSLEKELDRNDLSEGKKEKILKKFDKRAFLDTLMGQTKSINVDEATQSIKEDLKTEDVIPKWNALRDDFMMGAKMKDWDKESVDE